MKRELTNKERELCEKGIKRRKSKIEDLSEQLEYNKSLIEKQNYLRKFDDKWRPYLRKNKDKEDKKILELMANEIKSETKAMETEQDQLENGVEIKKATGVN